MSLKQTLESNEDALEQVAGLTGFGWTASLLGYLSVLVGYSSAFVTNPQSLLYLGGVLFVTTLGLDQLRERLSERKP
jgi:hypothetical protein